MRKATISDIEKRSVITTCEAFVRDILKPKFLREIEPTQWNYVVDIKGAYAAGRYRFIQQYRSGFPDNSGEEFDSPFARIDWVAAKRFDIQWMRHTGNGGHYTGTFRSPKRFGRSRPTVSYTRTDLAPAESTARGPWGAIVSEYQYYEFRAIDRPLSASDRSALRNLSTRAEITHTRASDVHSGSLRDA